MAQALTIIVSPILTRLYTPADFGTLAAFAAMMAPLGVIALGKYDAALLIERDPIKGINLLAVSLSVGLLMSLLTALGAHLSGSFLEKMLNIPQMATHVWLLPFAVLGAASYASFTSWALRRKDYDGVSKSRLKRSALRAAIQCGSGLLGGGPMGLLAGEVVGQGSGLPSLIRAVRRSDAALLREISGSRMREVATAHARFPLLTMPASLFGAVGTSMPYILLPMQYGQVESGLFLISLRLTSAPLMLWGAAVGQSYYADLSSRASDGVGNLRRFRKISIALALGGAGIGVGAASAPLWLSAALGNAWAPAGLVMVSLSPMLAVQMVVSPLTQTYQVFGRQGLQLAVESLRFLASLTTFILCPLFGATFVHAVLVWSLAVTSIYVVHWILMHGILVAQARTAQPLADAAIGGKLAAN